MWHSRRAFERNLQPTKHRRLPPNPERNIQARKHIEPMIKPEDQNKLQTFNKPKKTQDQLLKPNKPLQTVNGQRDCAMRCAHVTF